ncbi:YcaO-like family protein [Streptomyces sp. NPDC048111]|uniref:YcaO-like family protein n=1 Tax=Streptomyces sp. NPDC048111 TaxID=3365500 RepID=UPI00372362E9
MFLDIAAIPTRWQVPCFAAFVWSEDFALLTAGSGAHSSPSVALCRAVTEAVQSRLTIINGARDDPTAAYSHVLKGSTRRPAPAPRAAPYQDALSTPGATFTSVDTELAVLQTGGSGISAGLALGCSVATQMLLGPYGGVLADRLPRKTLAISANIVLASVRALLGTLLTAAPHHTALWMFATTGAATATVQPPSRDCSSNSSPSPPCRRQTLHYASSSAWPASPYRASDHYWAPHSASATSSSPGLAGLGVTTPGWSDVYLSGDIAVRLEGPAARKSLRSR